MTESIQSNFELLPEHQGQPEKMVNFGDVSRTYLGLQSQYGSRYVQGTNEGYPNLGEGLVFEGDTVNYHMLHIRQGDIPTFLARYIEHQRQRQGR